MSNSVSVTPKTYHDSVMMWGNRSPWKQLNVRLSHKVDFHPSEVVRDGRGNILSMPVLEQKPCFGRPEVFFRHGERKKYIQQGNGSTRIWTNHRCGTCPEGVHTACNQTAAERVTSHPRICQAFLAWEDHCETYYKGAAICTGSASRLWGDFKLAIAQRGPFHSSNDAAVADLVLQKRNAQQEKWRREKRSFRQLERDRSKAARQSPSRQYVSNLNDERKCRADALLTVLGQSGQPPSRAKVPADKREATAMITANAWAMSELLHASGRDARPGTIARKMVELKWNAGVAGSTLKARIKNDLKRADECERDGLWKPFDPDADLDSYENEDDGASDALNDPVSEIDHILSDLNLANLSLP